MLPWLKSNHERSPLAALRAESVELGARLKSALGANGEEREDERNIMID
jgi:hypothetical protein